MSCVTFLPQKFKSPHKWLCAVLPPCDICPLIYHKRKITITMNPLGKHVIHYGFACRPNLPQSQE
uniref:ProlinetRNA ligaseic/mitochondrial-like n=1 Tax=Rhizophora mucronata TaxID=61149 RepID=A0A2P2L0E8_RHIMU